ncbi:MAG: phenylacetate--CoA ligase [Clostridiales Family XIII bacterium]|jgi:phenylacetate-CoA ligase|nr:phenylacetate--CoA ligase [Clostridiales Family XIII bacterium]
MIWNEPKECMSQDEMRHLQNIRLKSTARRVFHNVPFYRKKMQELGIEPDDIKDIGDIGKLPFTTKQDLRDNYPFGLAAMPRSEFVRVHASSGTTGKPTSIPHSRKDLDMFAECVARALCCAGATRNDVVQVSYGYGLFTGGLGLHDGATRLGATVIPASGGNTRNQLTLLQDFGSTVLACTPSYALYISEALADAGIDASKLPLRIGVFGAEPWSAEMRAKIEDGLQIQAFDIYGLSEVMGPGMSNSCEAKDGLHIAEDHFYPEILDPDTLKPLPDGEMGELVFTHLTKEAMPLLRYRTRDLSSLSRGGCVCGRTNVRMSKVKGRSDDMLIIRGVNVFPSQIESVLLEIPEAKPHYMIVVDREGALDTLEVQVEIDERHFSDEMAQIGALRGRIKHALDSALRVGTKVTLVEHRTIQRSEGKAKRVIDRRKI